MSELTAAGPAVNPNPAETLTSATQPLAPPAPSQTVAVDMEALNKAAESRAERAAQTAVRETLKQQGLDEEAIKGVIAEWKSKQVTPEQTIKEQNDTINGLQQQLEAERQEKIALSKGVPLGSADETVKEKAIACITLAKSYVTDTVTFEAALDKALQVISFEEQKPPPPPMAAGTGGTPVTATEAELLKQQYADAQKINDTTEMVKLTRIAQKKGIKL